MDQFEMFLKISTLFLSEMKGLCGLSIERSNMLLNGSSSEISRVSAASLAVSVTWELHLLDEVVIMAHLICVCICPRFYISK